MHLTWRCLLLFQRLQLDLLLDMLLSMKQKGLLQAWQLASLKKKLDSEKRDFFELHLSLSCELLLLDFVKLLLFGRTELGIRLQHGGHLFENLSVDSATVLREGFAADEELRDSSVYCIVGDSWRFRSFELHPALGENLCPCPRCRNQFLGA